MSFTSLRLDSNPITSPKWAHRRLPHRCLLHPRNVVVCSVKSPTSSPSLSVAASDSLSRIESLSQVSGVLGCQWGDEGKGKLVDILAQHFDVVARCQVTLLSLYFVGNKKNNAFCSKVTGKDGGFLVMSMQFLIL